MSAPSPPEVDGRKPGARGLSRRLLLGGAGVVTAGILAGLFEDFRHSPSSGPVTNEGWPGGLRGVGVSSSISDEALTAFAATSGNLVRIMCSNTPLRDLSPPFAINQASFARLDRLLTMCRKLRLRAVLDPHAFPGMASRYTVRPTDALWREGRYQDLMVELWDYLADRYRHAGDVIAGYDLLNEPAVPDVTATSGLASWNALAVRLVAAVRRHDRQHTVIIEPAVGRGPNGGWYSRFDAMRYLLAPPDRRTVVSPHMYAPQAFTFQGVNQRPTGYHYPGRIDGRVWNKAALAGYMAPARAYQQRYGVPVYIGEFSAARWTGADGLAYLRDCIDVFEEAGWDWTYVGWREFQGWDAEMSSEAADLRRHRSTPRLQLLERYFGRNHYR